MPLQPLHRVEPVRKAPEVRDDERLRREVLELFESHGAALYRFASVALRRRADAEDVVQESFVRLLRHLEAGGARTHLKGWLFTVAANLCRDHNRRGWRWTPWRPEADPRVARPELDAALDAADDRARLLDALGGLRPRDRFLLLLRASGLSYREVAEAAGVAEGSVGRFLSRALERLRRAWLRKGGRT